MVQTFVHSENGLGLRFRLQLRPQLINLNEIFRKCGHDTNQNLQFTAIFADMTQLDTNGTFKVSENLLPTLYSLLLELARKFFFPWLDAEIFSAPSQNIFFRGNAETRNLSLNTIYRSRSDGNGVQRGPLASPIIDLIQNLLSYKNYGFLM